MRSMVKAFNAGLVALMNDQGRGIDSVLKRSARKRHVETLRPPRRSTRNGPSGWPGVWASATSTMRVSPRSIALDRRDQPAAAHAGAVGGLHTRFPAAALRARDIPRQVKASDDDFRRHALALLAATPLPARRGLRRAGCASCQHVPFGPTSFFLLAQRGLFQDAGLGSRFRKAAARAAVVPQVAPRDTRRATAKAR